MIHAPAVTTQALGEKPQSASRCAVQLSRWSWRLELPASWGGRRGGPRLAMSDELGGSKRLKTVGEDPYSATVLVRGITHLEGARKRYIASR